MNPPARTTGVYGPRGVGARGGKTRWMLMRVRRSSCAAQAGARRRRSWRSAYALASSSAWRWRIGLEDGRLPFDVGLRLIFFDFVHDFGRRLRRLGGRVEFGPEIRQHALVFMRLQPDHRLVLGVV